MTESEFSELLQEVLYDNLVIEDNQLVSAKSFESAGILTSNEGIVVKMIDGSEFQVTIVKAR